MRPSDHLEAMQPNHLAMAALVVGVGSGFIGLAFVDGYATAVLIGLAIAVAAALACLAMTRMMTFALALLAMRSTLDITHMRDGGVPGGTSGLAAAAVSILLIVAAAFWIAAQHRAGRCVLSPLSYAALAVVAATVLSAAGSVRPVVSLIEAARVTSAVAMLLLLMPLLRTRKDIRRTLRFVYASMFVPLAAAVIQAVSSGGGSQLSHVSRVTGTFRHPNPFGAYLAVLLVAGVALLRGASSRERIALRMLLGAGFIVLVLTYSRGSWTAAALGLLVVAAIQRRPSLVALLVVIVIATAFMPSVQLRLSDLGEARSLTGTGGNSLVWRLDYWRDLIELAERSPATGIGLDMAQFETIEANQPHNDYVRMYVEAGWIGLLSLVALLVMLAATARDAWHLGEGIEERAVAAGFAGSTAVVVVVMIGGNLISSVVTLWYFFALAACAHCVAREGRRRTSLAGSADGHGSRQLAWC